jgi:stage II sporulation protein E
MYDTVSSFSPAEKKYDDPAVIFDRASETVCRDCTMNTRCWQQDYQNTVDIMNGITPRLMKSGKISSGDFPLRFADTCTRLDKLTSAINSEAHTLLLKKQFKSIISENQVTAYSQYADTALVLHFVSQELGNEITVDAALEKKLGKYLRSMNIDATAAVFRVRSGRLRAEIVGNVSALRSDDECLNKLSTLLGVRLCSAPSGSSQRFVLLEAEPLMVTIGTSSARKAGNRVNGDNSFCFRTDDGKFYAILSDGMGSGEEADKISSTAISTLQKFLSAGISPELSLKLLSDSMFLKNETATESASVDLFELNMFTGETRIFKCGASPTYLKRGELIRRVSGGVLPAGLTRPSKEKPSCAKFRLQAESFAVLISDGVLSGTDDKWLRELISSFSDTDPKALARKILERSMELNGDMDDMTVLAIRIDDRD